MRIMFVFSALLGLPMALLGCGEGSACRASGDCRGDLFCAGPNEPNVCGMPPREQCAASADCSPGGLCHVVVDPCSPDGIGSECRGSCLPSGACGPGLRCNAAGACEAIPCDEGFACPAHQRCDAALAHGGGPVHAQAHGCVNVACSNDAACAPGQACVNQICQTSAGTCRVPMVVP